MAKVFTYRSDRFFTRTLPLFEECAINTQRKVIQLSENIASLVWSTKPAYAQALKALDPTAMAAMINAAFRLPYHSISHLYALITNPHQPISTASLIDEINWRSSPEILNPDDIPDETSVPPLVRNIQMGSVASFPLRMSHALSYLGDPIGVEGLPSRTALLGDAAHTVHPLAGQGLNLGLGDVASLRQVLEKAAYEGADCGELSLALFLRLY